MAPIDIRPLTEPDIPALIALTRTIWHSHYPGIITVEQIEYMLDQRYRPEIIREQLHTADIWWHALWLDGIIMGFSACELSYSSNALKEPEGSRPFDGTGSTAELKLDKLYVHQDLHGQGYGSRLLRHAEDLARREHCRAVYLQVNKQNAKAIAAYQRNGYVVRASATFDIGCGYVMDDYVMAKDLAQHTHDRRPAGDQVS
jgi:diamine N-acetyltransferase